MLAAGSQSLTVYMHPRSPSNAFLLMACVDLLSEATAVAAYQQSENLQTAMPQLSHKPQSVQSVTSMLMPSWGNSTDFRRGFLVVLIHSPYLSELVCAAT